MNQNPAVHQLRPNNTSTRRQSKLKYGNMQLGAITEENATSSAMTSIENSHRKLEFTS